MMSSFAGPELTNEIGFDRHYEIIYIKLKKITKSGQAARSPVTNHWSPSPQLRKVPHNAQIAQRYLSVRYPITLLFPLPERSERFLSQQLDHRNRALGRRNSELLVNE